MPAKKQLRHLRGGGRILSTNEAPAFIYNGTVDAAALTASKLWASKDPKDWFTQAHKVETIPFISTVTRLNRSLYNFGLKVEPVIPEDSGERTEKRIRKEFEEWYRGSGSERTGESLSHSIAVRTWHDLLLCDNAVVSWMKTSDSPRTLALEDCDYRNDLGIPILKWTHRIPADQVRELRRVMAESGKLTRSQLDLFVQRYTRTEGNIQIQDPKWNEAVPELADYFSIVTALPDAPGFVRPSIVGLFPACDQFQSMESGEAGLGWLSRNSWEQHSLGYEPQAQYGTGKTSPDPKRMLAVKKEYAGKLGARFIVTPFDHKITSVWVDPKYFTAEKWDTFLKRASIWGGPMAYLLLTAQQGTASTQLGLLKVLADESRKQMRFMLEPLLTRFAGMPVRVSWSNACFFDQRVFADLIKSAVGQGAASYTTLLAAILGEGSIEVEMENKALEQEKYEDTLAPHFDQHHGNPDPGQPGRPDGTLDPT